MESFVRFSHQIQDDLGRVSRVARDQIRLTILFMENR
jgi:hypothetical protein